MSNTSCRTIPIESEVSIAIDNGDGTLGDWKTFQLADISQGGVGFYIEDDSEFNVNQKIEIKVGDFSALKGKIVHMEESKSHKSMLKVGVALE